MTALILKFCQNHFFSNSFNHGRKSSNVADAFCQSLVLIETPVNTFLSVDIVNVKFY